MKFDSGRSVPDGAIFFLSVSSPLRAYARRGGVVDVLCDAGNILLSSSEIDINAEPGGWLQARSDFVIR